MGYDVVYASDDRYAMLAGVSMESLYANNEDLERLNVYILADGLTENNRSRLTEIAEKYGRELGFVEFDGKSLGEKYNINAQFWSVAAYTRLFTPQLLPEMHKILYLDCDTLVFGSILELLETELGDYSCAAVSEPISALHKKNVGLDASDNYFNSGVMLIDLNRWRQTGAVEKFLDCICRHKGRVPYVDQGVINEVFRGEIMTLPTRYNVSTFYFDFSYKEAQRYRAGEIAYSKSEVETAKREPTIVHYNSSFLTPRPWIKNSTHPYAPQWESFCERTPWRGAEKWPDKPGTSKLTLRWIFNHTPRPVGIWIARTVNSTIRPLIKL